jgi:hypothetical protein
MTMHAESRRSARQSAAASSCAKFPAPRGISGDEIVRTEVAPEAVEFPHPRPRMGQRSVSAIGRRAKRDFSVGAEGDGFNSATRRRTWRSTRPSAKAISSNDAVLPARTASIQLRERAIACSRVARVLGSMLPCSAGAWEEVLEQKGSSAWLERSPRLPALMGPVQLRDCAGDRDLICVDHDALDMLADELMVPDVNVGSSCLRIGSPRLP